LKTLFDSFLADIAGGKMTFDEWQAYLADKKKKDELKIKLQDEEFQLFYSL
jgi:hypothetical protein